MSTPPDDLQELVDAFTAQLEDVVQDAVSRALDQVRARLFGVSLTPEELARYAKAFGTDDNGGDV